MNRMCAVCGERYDLRLKACPACAKADEPVTDRDAQYRQAIQRSVASLGTPEELEQRARAVAIRFGVNPNLRPRDRCLAILKACRRPVLERVPGEDDE